MITIPFDFNPNNTTRRSGSNLVPAGRRWFVQPLTGGITVDGTQMDAAINISMSIPSIAGTVIKQMPLQGHIYAASFNYQVTVAGAWTIEVHKSPEALDQVPYVKITGTGNVTGTKTFIDPTTINDLTFVSPYDYFPLNAYVKITAANVGTFNIVPVGRRMPDSNDGFWVKEGAIVDGASYRVTEYLNAT